MKKIYILLLSILITCKVFGQTPTSPTPVNQMTWYKDASGHMWANRGTTLGYIQMIDFSQLSSFGIKDSALNINKNLFDVPNKLTARINIGLNGTHTPGYGLSGSNYNATANQTWTVDTTSSTGLLSKSRANSNYVYLFGTYTNPSWITALAWSKITSTPTTIAGYGITDFNSTGDARYLQLTGGTMTGDIILPSTLPSNANQAVPKFWIDNLLTGITWKNAVRVKTTANIALSGTQTVDGVALAVNDRVLVNNQTNQTQNGIYTVASGAWVRATDANTGALISTATVAVTLGTLNKNTQWTNTNTSVPTIGTDAITFGQISGAGTYTNGTYLTLTGNVFDANLTALNTLYPQLSGSYANPSWITSLAQSKITYTGSTSQYIRGDGSLGTTPTNVSSFTNDAGYLTNTTGDARYVSLSGSYTNPSWITSLPWSKITGTPTTISGYVITDFNSTGDARYLQLSGGTMAGNILLSANNTYNLGSLATRLANVYSINTTSSSVYTLALRSINTGISFTNNMATTSWAQIFETGNMLIQTGGTFTDNGYKLDVQGTFRTTGHVTLEGVTSTGATGTGNLVFQSVLPIAGSFSGVGTATTTFTVTIGTTQANNTYKVNVTATDLLGAAAYYVTNKTTTTFDVVYVTGLTGTLTFDWALFK